MGFADFYASGHLVHYAAPASSLLSLSRAYLSWTWVLGFCHDHSAKHRPCMAAKGLKRVSVISNLPIVVHSVDLLGTSGISNPSVESRELAIPSSASSGKADMHLKPWLS